jgi:hypothetical protein
VVLQPRQNGKTETLIPTGAHQPEGGARDAVIQHGGSGGESLAERWGKVLKGVPGKFIAKQHPE